MPPSPPPIDRAAVVARHRVVVTRHDPMLPLTVGNGEFAFTADVTGLQTFPDAYADAIPLCTQSHWGWHSFPTPPELRSATFRYTEFDTYGRPVGYAVDARGQEALFTHLRENPHRLHLGRIGLVLRDSAGREAGLADVSAARQELDLWTGVITSRFEFDGEPVVVESCCAGERDAVAVGVRSPLARDGRLQVLLAFPYGSPAPQAADWSRPEMHETRAIPRGAGRVDFVRRLDNDGYHVALAWTGPARLGPESPHAFQLRADDGVDTIAFTCTFAPSAIEGDLPTFEQAARDSARFWSAYWESGGAIDFTGSADPRAPELERRVVLSQYLMRANCAGSLPPAETGLTCNSWYGKFHLEMHWWHGVHFALWGRLPLLERSLAYHHRTLPAARATARRQGYEGARWPKMVSPDGTDSPSPVGPLLLWQQPHPIYYAELCYRERPTRATLEQWREIVHETAAFMTSFAQWDEQAKRYVLGPPMKTVSENTDPRTTRNAAFELTYWRFGLRVAQQWRERLGLPREPHWDRVLESLAPLPQDDGVYLLQEGTTDTYTKWNWEHPALVGIRGVLPGDGVDPATHRRTVERAMHLWQWDRSWGWDFPMMAMAAARAGRPDLAVDALFLESTKNTYSVSGHNYQRPNLPLYLPGNGGLLAAVAMMATGWDGGPDQDAPGFPRDGWVVRHEGLRRMP